MTVRTMPKKPEQVTAENWNELEAKGFRWMANFSWPPRTAHLREFICNLYGRHGHHAVLIGWPRSKNMVPVDNPDSSQVGLYIRVG